VSRDGEVLVEPVRADFRSQEDEDTPEIRLGPRLSSQPFQPGAPPHQPGATQEETLPGPGGAAGSHGLKPVWVWANCAQSETSCRYTDSTNNSVENSHLPFRRRKRAMLRFRGMKTLQTSCPWTDRIERRPARPSVPAGRRRLGVRPQATSRGWPGAC
jgi:hypothetical protein